MNLFKHAQIFSQKILVLKESKKSLYESCRSEVLHLASVAPVAFQQGQKFPLLHLQRLDLQLGAAVALLPFAHLLFQRHRLVKPEKVFGKELELKKGFQNRERIVSVAKAKAS